MSVTFQQIQEFYCGALNDIINSEQSVHPFMYSLFGVMSMPTKTEDSSRIYWKASDLRTMNLIDKALICLGMTMEVLPDDMNVIPYTVEFVNEAISSWSPHTRKAACLAIAVIADSDRADRECLQKLLPFVMIGISDRHPAVRNAALCALGQFHSNKEINLQHYYEELFVPLLYCLRLLSKPLKTSVAKPCELPPPPYVGALFDTIVSLCREKNDKMKSTFRSYSSKVVKYLLRIVNASCDISIREMAIDAVKEIIRVSEKELVFHRFGKFLQTFLKIRPTAELHNILVALLEIFEMMGERLADADFKPLAKKCFQFITAGIKVFHDYPILKRVFKLLVELRVVVDEEMDKIVLEVIHVWKSKFEERQERDGNVQNASLVPVGSDGGDLDAGQTNTGNNIASGEVEPPDADNYRRRSMSISSISTVCIEHKEETRSGSPLVQRSYEVPRRSSSVSGSICSSRSGRRRCRMSRRRGVRSLSGSPSSRSYRRRRRHRSDSSSRSRSRSSRRKRSVSRFRSSACSPDKNQSSVDHRRIVYVNYISKEPTKNDLLRRFKKFGRFIQISLYCRESSNSLGHIEFARAEDARVAVLHGNDDPYFPYNVSFGSGSFRRRCKYQGAVASNGNITPQPREEHSFDILLTFF